MRSFIGAFVNTVGDAARIESKAALKHVVVTVCTNVMTFSCILTNEVSTI
jgi:hypothetical protein